MKEVCQFILDEPQMDPDLQPAPQAASHPDGPPNPQVHVPLVPTPQPEQTRGNSDLFRSLVDEFPPSIVEPTEMLRYLQNKIIKGCPLEVTDLTTAPTGETNFITVDRDNIIETTFEELKGVEDPTVTFQVQFYGEQAFDSGGPRKEWIRLCNQQIKIKYFDHGLKEHLADDYFYVGQMAGIALLQNDQIPRYFPEEMLQEIFISEDQNPPPCFIQLRKGLDMLGIHIFGRKFPMFPHLLRVSNTQMSVKMLIHLLKPTFSEEGSNSLIYEKVVYSKFVKYVREVASGRRVTSLENILEFVTGASEEPPLGFAQHPICGTNKRGADIFRLRPGKINFD